MIRHFFMTVGVCGTLGACAPSVENTAFNTTEITALTQLCVVGAGEAGLIERGYQRSVGGYGLAPPGGTLMQNSAVLTTSTSPCSIVASPATVRQTITTMGRALIGMGFTQVDDETFVRGSDRFRLVGRTGAGGGFVSLSRP